MSTYVCAYLLQMFVVVLYVAILILNHLILNHLQLTWQASEMEWCYRVATFSDKPGNLGVSGTSKLGENYSLEA